MADTRQMDMRLLDLQNEMERVRGLYDQYFAGVLKQEPRKEHDGLIKIVKSIKPGDVKTTASRFKFQSLQQRYTSYSTHWQKILKQMEEGTFRRDLAYLRRVKNVLKEEAPATNKSSPNLGGTAKKDGSAGDTVKLKAYPPSLEKLYEKVSALSAEKGSKVPNREKFLDSITQQIQSQKTKNPGKKVEVKVAKNKDGKIEVKISAQ